MMERHNLAISEYKADEQGIFSGYLSTYGPDLVGDRIMPGAFGATIADSHGRVPIFLNHNMDDWVGQTTKLTEDEKGLAFTAQIFLGMSRGRDAYELLKAAREHNFKVGMSIGFSTKEYEMDGMVRMIKEIKLYEGSITPFPAQPRARVADVKTVRDLEQFLRDAGCSNQEAKRLISTARDPNPDPQWDVEAETFLQTIRSNRMALAVHSMRNNLHA